VHRLGTLAAGDQLDTEVLARSKLQNLDQNEPGYAQS